MRPTFLATMLIAGLAAGYFIDQPERSVWVPGQEALVVHERGYAVGDAVTIVPPDGSYAYITNLHVGPDAQLIVDTVAKP